VIDELLAEPVKQRLEAFGERHAEAHQNASPFPHTVIDDFLPPDLLTRVIESFPGPADFKWLRWDGKHEKKLAWFEAERLVPELRDTLYFLNSAITLRFLEKLTGIKGLIPDPYFYGGGLHQIEPGGFLEVHADFNRLPELHIERRINLLLYLNQDWREEYGGHLELWERDMSSCAKRILPVFNRCVVFDTTSTSYHGHPLPLTCPPDRSRRSIALYYYTATLDDGTKPPEHSTLFQDRPSEEEQRQRRLRQTIKRFVPPIVVDAYRKLRG